MAYLCLELMRHFNNIKLYTETLQFLLHSIYKHSYISRYTFLWIYFLIEWPIGSDNGAYNLRNIRVFHLILNYNELYFRSLDFFSVLWPFRRIILILIRHANFVLCTWNRNPSIIQLKRNQCICNEHPPKVSEVVCKLYENEEN